MPGDTVFDVYVDNNLCEFPGELPPVLLDMIVDSVITYENDGIEVIRHYVHTPCYDGNNASWNAHRFFWQAGMGTSGGPFMQIRPGLSPIDLYCARVDTTVVYGLGGFPGGPLTCCYPISQSMGDPITPVNYLDLWPNPATNTLNIRCSDERESTIRMYDSMGRLVLTTTMRGPLLILDVTELSGLYIVVLADDLSTRSTRVIIH